MKSIIKKWTASTMIIFVLLTMALPVSAATSFGVLLSSYEAKAKSSVEFQIITEKKAIIFTGSTIKVQFPRQWVIPTKINKSDILLNGEVAQDVTVDQYVVTIVAPSSLNEKTDVVVEFKPEAGLINPDKAGKYTIKVGVQVNDKLQISGKLRDRFVTQNFSSDSITIEASKTPTPTPTPTTPATPATPTAPSSGTPTDNPLELPDSVDTSGALHKVIVRIGSAVGYYEKPSSSKKSLVQKVGTLTYAPYINNGHTMIPFRFVADGLGATIAYDQKTGVVGVNHEGDYMEFKAGSKTAVINGLPYEMPIAPEIKEKQMMIPLRFAVEEMGAAVKWIGETQTILITK